MLDEHVSLAMDECKFYSSLVPTWASASTLHKFISSYVERPVNPFEMHSTVIWSSTKVLDYIPINFAITISPKTYEYDILGGCWVLKYYHPIPQAQWQKAKSLGALFTFDKYVQHITLSYDPGENFDYSKIPLPGFPITFSREMVEDN